MRILRIAFIAFITGFSGAMMPGPMLALTIGQVAVLGFWAAPVIVAGHAALELLVVIGLVLGLRVVLAKTAVRGAIGILGGAALLYMGYDMVRGAADLQLETGNVASMPWAKLMLAGAAVCIANPYFIAWWATIGAGQVAHTNPQTVGEYVAFYLGHELSDLTWYCFVAVVVVLGKQRLELGWLIAACGVIVILLGIWFIYAGVRFAIGRQAEAEKTAADRLGGTTED